MWIDFASVFVFALFVVFGAITGGIAQLLRLGAAIAAFIGAPAAADFVRPFLGGLFVDLNELLLQAASLIVAVILLYLGLVVVIWLTIERWLEHSLILGAMDRLIGAALGALKALILIFVLGHALFLMSSVIPAEQFHQSVLLDLIGLVRMDRFLDLEHLGGELLDWLNLSADNAHRICASLV